MILSLIVLKKKKYYQYEKLVSQKQSFKHFSFCGIFILHFVFSVIISVEI